MKQSLFKLKSDHPGGISNRILIALFSLIAISLVLGGMVFYRRQTQSIREDKMQQLKSIAELKVNQLVQWRVERLSDIRANSQDPFLKHAVNLWISQPDNIALGADIETRLRLLMNQKGYDYNNVLLTASDGQILFSADPLQNEMESETLLLAEQAVSTGEAQIGDFYHCDTTDQIHIDIAAAMYDENEQVMAVLILRVDPEKYLYPLIQSWPTPSQSAETLLIRQEGDEILFLNTLRHSTAKPLTLRIHMDNTDVPAVAAVLGQKGQFDGIDYRGEAVLAELLPVPGTPWFMISKVDAVEILSEIRLLGQVVMLFVVLSILMTTALVAYIFNNRQRLLYQNMLHAAQERNEIQEEIKMTLYSIGDGVITTDKEGKVNRMNTVAEALTGWSEAESQGVPLTQVFNIINEVSRSEVENPVEHVLREGEIVGLANHTLLVARDGTEYPISDSGAPIRGSKGEIIGVVLVFRDQSEERAAERERALLNHTISASLNEIYLFDAKTLRFRFANDGALKNLGYGLDELRLITPVDVKPEFSLEIFKQMIQPLIEHKKQVLTFKTVHQRADGSLYPIEANMQLFEFENEQVFLAVINDITERKRAENALQESEARFRAIIEQSFDGILVSDKALCIIEWNTAQTKIFGFTRDEMIGKPLWEYQFSITPDEQKTPQLLETLKEKASKSINSDSSLNLNSLRTLNVQAKDGSLKTIQISSFPIEVSDAILYCLITRDITAEQAAEQNYQMLFREMLDGFAIHEIILDNQGVPIDYRFLSMNPAFERMTGLKEADIKGRTVLDVLPGTEKYWIDIYGQVALTGKPAFFENYSRELEKYFEVTVFRPAPNQFTTIFTDITERKQAEEALRQNEEKFRYIFDHSVIGKSLTLPSGEINVNKAFCEMLGYTQEELQNKKWQEITHADDIELSQKKLDPLISGEKESTRFIKRYIHKSGAVVWTDVNTSLRRDQEGNPLYFITAIVNITERKQQEIQLNKQVEELRRWHNITLGREDRIMALKREVNKLLVEMGQPVRYDSAQEENTHE